MNTSWNGVTKEGLENEVGGNCLDDNYFESCQYIWTLVGTKWIDKLT